MKNGVECYKDFFPYFKALKTNCVCLSALSDLQLHYENGGFGNVYLLALDNTKR